MAALETLDDGGSFLSDGDVSAADPQRCRAEPVRQRHPHLRAADAGPHDLPQRLVGDARRIPEWRCLGRIPRWRCRRRQRNRTAGPGPHPLVSSAPLCLCGDRHDRREQGHGQSGRDDDMTIPGRLAACVTPHAGYHPLNLTKQVWILGTGRKPRHRPQPPSVGDILHRRAPLEPGFCVTDISDLGGRPISWIVALRALRSQSQ